MNYGNVNVTISLQRNETNTVGKGSNLNLTEDVRNEDLAKVELAILATVFGMAVFGNSFVLVSLIATRRRFSRMQLFIIHLSVADLFVAFFHVLPQFLWDLTYRFHGNDGLCRSVKLLQIVAVYASSYVLVMTAIDRFYAICRPLTSHLWTSRRVHLMVALAWVMSLVFSSPQLFIFSYREVKVGSGVYDCWAVFNPPWFLELYVTWFTTSVFFIPVIILVVTYSFICFHVWTRGKMTSIRECSSPNPSQRPSPCSSPIPGRIRGNNRRLAKGERNSNSLGADLNSSKCLTECSGSKLNINRKSGLSVAKIRTFKLTLTVILCFIVCWAPFFIVQLWSAYDSTAPFTGPVMTILVLLASLNSCTNPWIYLAFSKNLCNEVKHRIPKTKRDILGHQQVMSFMRPTRGFAADSCNTLYTNQAGV